MPRSTCRARGPGKEERTAAAARAEAEAGVRVVRIPRAVKEAKESRRAREKGKAPRAAEKGRAKEKEKANPVRRRVRESRPLDAQTTFASIGSETERAVEGTTVGLSIPCRER
jgi:hypothetical protein